jgi:hypothetical protein
VTVNIGTGSSVADDGQDDIARPQAPAAGCPVGQLAKVTTPSYVATGRPLSADHARKPVCGRPRHAFVHDRREGTGFAGAMMEA